MRATWILLPGGATFPIRLVGRRNLRGVAAAAAPNCVLQNDATSRKDDAKEVSWRRASSLAQEGSWSWASETVADCVCNNACMYVLPRRPCVYGHNCFGSETAAACVYGDMYVRMSQIKAHIDERIHFI